MWTKFELKPSILEPMQEVEEHIPCLAQWTRWCYADSSHLWFGDELIESEQGVQQGDPLGPLFFAFALRKLPNKMVDRWPELLLHSWSLDEVTLIGKREDLARIMAFLVSAETVGLGLHINVGRCEVWWPSGDAQVPGLPTTVKRMRLEGTEILNLLPHAYKRVSAK